MDNETLIARLADDINGTFEALVLAHQNRLYTIALRLLGDPRDAEEVAQDALVRAYRALQTYEPPRIRDLRLRPWLAAIVVNLARNKRRRRADRVALIDLASLADVRAALATSLVVAATATLIALVIGSAAAFAVQQTLIRYPQVAASYAPADGYFPLAPWAGFAVLCGYTACALGLAAHLVRRRDV